MKKVACVLSLLAAAILVGCVWPGTTTLHLKNVSEQNINAVYLYPLGAGDMGANRLAAPLEPDRTENIYSIDPGTYTLRWVFADLTENAASFNASKDTWSMRLLD